jgi:hypothetical protein
MTYSMKSYTLSFTGFAVPLISDGDSARASVAFPDRIGLPVAVASAGLENCDSEPDVRYLFVT